MNKLGFVITTLLVGLALFASTLFVVDQRQFGVLYSFGQIKEVITEPGLRFKLPQPFQNVVFLDRRVLTLDDPLECRAGGLRHMHKDSCSGVPARSGFIGWCTHDWKQVVQ